MTGKMIQIKYCQMGWHFELGQLFNLGVIKNVASLVPNYTGLVLPSWNFFCMKLKVYSICDLAKKEFLRLDQN